LALLNALKQDNQALQVSKVFYFFSDQTFARNELVDIDDIGGTTKNLILNKNM
jgi:hypothetical protein